MRALVMLAVVSTISLFGFEAYSGTLGLIPHHFDTEQRDGIRVIKVPAGGSLQAAIDQASSGDIVELEAGAVYSGQINLSNKPLTDYVTIRSSAAGQLPPDKRVSPSQRGFMAVIQSGMLGRAAVAAANGAHHYRFVGIEFTPSSSSYNYGIIKFGNEESRADKVPHHLEIDRSYIHSFKTGATRRGIALNSAETTIKNSYIEGMAAAGEETQGICGWTGTHDVKIINNYVEGGAENIMFGGGDPDSADLIPSDIEIRGNDLNKPAAWRGKVTTKTLFELKNAKRVLFAGNVLTNNWEGSAMRLTVRNQDNGAPFSTIEDITIRDNVVSGAGEGVNILGKDDEHPSQTMRTVNIVNNLFLRIGGREFEGMGYFIQISDGRDITVAHNTVINTGNITTFHGELPTNFIFRDNILSHGNYGVHGLDDIRSDRARSIFQNNIFMNLAGVGDGDTSFPAGNEFVGGLSQVGFEDPASSDFRLRSDSRYKRKATDGGDPGADLATVPTFR